MLDKSWLIVSCVALAVVAAAVYVERAPRVYEATTTVQVEQADAKVVKAEQVVSEDMRGLDILNTVAQKLGNTALLQQVLETNHLLPSEGTVVTKGSGTLTREQAIAKFARNVKTPLRRNTRLIDTTVRNTDSVLAARLANSLVENYLAQDARRAARHHRGRQRLSSAGSRAAEEKTGGVRAGFAGLSQESRLGIPGYKARTLLPRNFRI